MVNKTGLIGVLAGLTVAAVAGIWVWNSAQTEAEKKVRRFVLEHDLEDRVSYSGVSYNPLSGELEISDLNLDIDKNTAPQIEKAVLFRLEESETEIPQEIGVELQGVQFELSEISNMSSDLHKELLSLGYENLSGVVRLEYKLDPVERRFALQLQLGVPQMGGIDFSGELLNVDFSDFSDEKTQKMMGNPFAWPTLLERMLGNIALVSLNLEYEDQGLVERYKKLVDARTQNWPDDPSTWENTATHHDEIARELKGQGLDAALASDIADALFDFVDSPDSIRFHTNIDEPVKLKKLLGTKKNPAAKFFDFTNAVIESN